MISAKKLRRIALGCQGLTKARPFGKGIEASLQTLEHLGYVQIDTLAVVERAHHHTLWTRIPDYQPEFLNELVRNRQAFEYWSHAASYLPVKDYRYALPRMSACKRGEYSYAKSDAKSMRNVLERIRLDGPLKARDFETAAKRKGSWWNWKPAKQALEQLFMQGDLMITARGGMEKIYDLTERVLPESVDTREPTLEEFSDYLIRTALRANGFISMKEFTHVRPGSALRNMLGVVLRHNIEEGAVVELSTDGQSTVFADPETLNRKTVQPPPAVRLLSPFDNAVIYRHRVQSLFDFDYRLECYVPQKKRLYGYFCLPILFRDEFAGRVDCKAHRKTGEFEIIHLHLDHAPDDIELFALRFAQSVKAFATFNDCDTLKLTSVTPKKWAGPLRRALKNACV